MQENVQNNIQNSWLPCQWEACSIISNLRNKCKHSKDSLSVFLTPDQLHKSEFRRAHDMFKVLQICSEYLSRAQSQLWSGSSQEEPVWLILCGQKSSTSKWSEYVSWDLSRCDTRVQTLLTRLMSHPTFSFISSLETSQTDLLSFPWTAVWSETEKRVFPGRDVAPQCFHNASFKLWRQKSVANKPGSRSRHVWFCRRDLGRQLDKSRLSSESLQCSSDYRTSRRGASSRRVSIISSVGQEGSSTFLPNPTWAEARPICQAWSHPETNCSAFPHGDS